MTTPTTPTGDVLDAEKINRLPHPLRAQLYGGSAWTVHDIEVQCALIRVDVSGLLDVHHFGSVKCLIDADGVEYPAEDFYLESQP